MPYIKILFDQIAFEPEVQTYCNNPKFNCPYYGHSWTCPPEAPYLEKEIAQFKEFYLIYHQFDVKVEVKKVKEKHPKRSENRIRSSIYIKSFIRDYLENEVYNFLDKFQDGLKDILVLWHGHCRVCGKESKKCTYDSGKICRYPDKKRFSMEAVGINVDKTVKNLNIQIEWPPINYIYHFGLVCLK